MAAAGSRVARGRRRRSRLLAAALAAAVVAVPVAACGRAGGPYRRARPATGHRSGEAAAGSSTRAARVTRRDHVTAKRWAAGQAPECREPGIDQVLQVPDPTAKRGMRSIWVHRPPGSDRASLPVFYFLHGSTTSETTLREEGMGPILDQAMCRTGVPFVVAAPNGHVADGSDTEWADSDDHRFRIETFVTDQAVAAVEGPHRRPAALRAIGGISMGGYGAAAIALRKPGLYGQVVTFAGYFHTDDRSHLFTAHDAEHSPDVLVAGPAATHIRWFLVEGADDHRRLSRGTIGGEAARFAALLRRRGATFELRLPPGGHVLATWLPLLPDAAEFLATGWVEPRDGVGASGMRRPGRVAGESASGR